MASFQPFDFFDARQARIEHALLCQRRGETPPADEPAEAQLRQAISQASGLALSGGGIRSATFNLGLLRALAGRGRLGEFDYLSTVSGGGYIGAFLGALLRRSAQQQPTADPAQTVRDVERVLASDGAPVLRWLRDNGRYLAPRGLADQLSAASLYLRNLLTLHVLLGISGLSVFLLWAALRLSGAALLPGLDSRFSAAWWLAGLLLLGWLALAWAYWMHRERPALAWEQRLIAFCLGMLAGGALWILWVDPQAGLPAAIVARFPAPAWGSLFLVAHGAWLMAWWLGRGQPGLDLVRNRLDRLQRHLLLALLIVAAFALLDELVVRLYQYNRAGAASAALLGAGASGAVLAVLRFLVPLWLGRLERRSAKPAVRPEFLATAAGLLLLFLVTFGWAYLVQCYVGAGATSGNPVVDLATVVAPWLLLALLIGLAGRNIDVLNQSSLHAFYTARLVRAYLGAGNPARHIPWTDRPAHAGQRMAPVSQVVADDDVALADAAPHRHGGPLHLINAHVNQTRFSAAGDFQPDRQGWNLAVGPAGFNLGRSGWQPADWAGAETLSLGQWIAISGAAFTTGAGPRTRLGFSALLGLLGVRLGYWWQAGEGRYASGRPHMLAVLWGEISGRFDPDSMRRWYLSDGGHFENTGAYELIRRRLKRIVLADCGADPEYRCEDLAGLVLKARIDFRCEIDFLDRSALAALWQENPRLLSHCDDPQALQGREGGAILLARLRYAGDAEAGWLVVVKPRLSGPLPLDLAHYARHQDRFPQQSTLDQFYDEAQWESTHRLGHHLGEQLIEVLDHLPDAAG